MPLQDQPRALVVEWARAGPLVVRGVEAEEVELHVVVTDNTATWGELLATVMELAPQRCSTDGCEDGWATLWLTTDDGATGSRKQVATVRHSVETVEGKLDKDIIRRIVRAHVNEIRSCYEAGLARDPSAGGSVTVEFTIAATGKVTSSQAASSTEVDGEIVTCITEAFTRWRFPKPSRGKVRVSYAVGLSVL
jgi:hypothetical protein